MARSSILLTVATVVLVSVCGITVQAEVVIETVTVGNPGNAGENSGESEPGGLGPDRICGAVDYAYNIGKFEVTAGQYAEFLNAVADEDTYGLYNTSMWTHSHGCKIERTGSSGSYVYTVAADWADRPVNWVSWGDAARFCNWLHNGQPTGVQDLTTTEDGSYYLSGATSDAALLAVVREPDATWVIPSEDEWYKAAYHYNDGVTGNYWDYPTESNTAPTSEAPAGTDMTNGSANYYVSDWAIGAPYYRTEVGAYDAKPSDSPYATFDQGGNVWEWNAAILYGSYRGLRGGSFYTDVIDGGLTAATRIKYYPTFEHIFIGFRVAEVFVDCNGNAIPDECDIDCGGIGGPCDVDGCGDSDDINGDGIPDECGACCTAAGCAQTTETLCGGPSKSKYNGDGTTCEEACPAGIPAVTSWGLLAMTLLVLSAGTLVLTKRRSGAAA